MLTCKVNTIGYYLRLSSRMSLRLEKYAHFIIAQFCFSVALQHLGPIDQNYVLFVCVFSISAFRLHEICLIVLAYFVDLYCKLRCFYNLEIHGFCLMTSISFICCLFLRVSAMAAFVSGASKFAMYPGNLLTKIHPQNK